MRKLVGITGSGMIGRDPFGADCWSKCGRYFFTECREAGLLQRAFGVEAPRHVRWPLILRNFSRNRTRWVKQFYLDTGYYDALTRQIGKRLTAEDLQCDLLQLGAIYDVPSLADGRTRCYSFHDGNLAQMVRSPFMPAGIPRRVIDRAMEYERRVYMGMDRIFTMSRYLQRSFVEDFGVDPQRVVCIGAGVNLDELPPETPKDYSRPEILFLGVDFARKGGEHLLRAFRIVRERLPRAKLHIVGPAAHDVSTRPPAGVTLHGFLSRSDPDQRRTMDELWDRASLFVFPSLYEPFGVAAIEALVHGIPCILTNRWAFPEMIDEGRNGELVECGNVEQLADSMQRLLEDPERLARMGRNGRRFVLERYTWRSVVGRLAEAIGD